MAKYVLLYISDESEHEETPEDQKVYQDIFKWFETNGSRFVNDGAELQPTRTATTIRRKNGKTTVVDGPFIEAKEALGGFSMIEAKDLDDAIAFAKTWPGYGVEVRPIVEH